MFERGDDIYYVNAFEGKVEGGKFLEHENDGDWIRLSGQAANKFVYNKISYNLIHRNEEAAKQELENIKSSIKSDLSNKDRLISEIVRKLSAHEGSFYVGIVKEVLEDKIKT